MSLSINGKPGKQPGQGAVVRARNSDLAGVQNRQGKEPAPDTKLEREGSKPRAAEAPATSASNVNPSILVANRGINISGPAAVVKPQSPTVCEEAIGHSGFSNIDDMLYWVNNGFINPGETFSLHLDSVNTVISYKMNDDGTWTCTGVADSN